MSSEVEVVRNDKFSPLAAIQFSSMVTGMKFLDACQACLFQRRISNWFCSLVFFLYLFLDVICSLIFRIESGRIRDVLSYILSLCVYSEASLREIEVAMVIYIFVIVLILIVLIINIALSWLGYPQMVDRYLNVLFCVLPVIYTPMVNIFLRCCQWDEGEFSVFTSIIIIVH